MKLEAIRRTVGALALGALVATTCPTTSSAQNLVGNTTTIDFVTGGSQSLLLQAPGFPNQFYFLVGTSAGTSLGFTASGALYTHADVLELRGTVIPVYALNAAFGNIPVLGDILTGAEKGGGVFAANFTMTGPVEKPDVTVNPLSALAPGILRNIFGVFGSVQGKTGGGPTPEPQQPVSRQ